jgi:succinoglycan biosynthesis transport protein ExoP
MSSLPVTSHPSPQAMSLPGMPTHAIPPQAKVAGGFDVRSIGGILRRRWLLLSTTILGITAVAAGYAMTREPVYAATAKIMIGLPESPALELADLVRGLPVTTERIENEIQLLQSRSLARKVVAATGLDRNPDYNPALSADENAGLIEQLTESLPTVQELTTQLGLAPYLPFLQKPSDGLAVESDALRPVIDAFLEDLSVWPEGRSHVINVSFESPDPVTAADVANAVAQIYIEDRLEVKLETSRRASGWLEGRIQELRAAAERKEAAVESYRSQEGLAAGEGGELTFERIAELNRELAVAKAAEVQAEARLANAEATLRTRGAEAVPEVLSSPTIQELRAAEAVAAATRAELGRDLGPRHPRMIDVNAQLRSIRSQIAIATRRILDSLRNSAEVAASRTSRIEEEMARLEGQITDRNDSEGQLRVLEREAEAAQEVYRTFLMRANSSAQNESIATADGRLISAAEMPQAPVGPKRKLLLMLGFALACFTGLAATLGREMLDRRFRTTDQIRDRLNIPVLGVVPMLGSVIKTRRAPQDEVVDGPDSVFGEAIRALRTSLGTIGDGPSPRTILVTSSVPGEGKTTLSLSTGRHSAISGIRTIVVDCDLRLPRVHEGLGMANGPGLIEFLRGASLSEVTRVDEQTGMHFISAGHWRRNAPELLRLPRMAELISLLQTRYDLVLLDTPPLLPVSDAAVIAGLADAVLLVVGWRNARPDTAQAAAERLRRTAGKARVAAVFNNVDVHKVAGYGAVEVDVYRGRYANYYAAA